MDKIKKQEFVNASDMESENMNNTEKATAEETVYADSEVFDKLSEKDKKKMKIRKILYPIAILAIILLWLSCFIK